MQSIKATDLVFPTSCPHCNSGDIYIADSEQATIDPNSRTFSIIYYWSCNHCDESWSQNLIAEIGQVISNTIE